MSNNNCKLAKTSEGLCATCTKYDNCHIIESRPDFQATICHYYAPALLEEIDNLRRLLGY